MEIEPGQMVFLVRHRGAVSYKINCVMLELSIAPTLDDLEAEKAESLSHYPQDIYCETD